MKTYAIIITILAVIAIVAAGCFYSQYSNVGNKTNALQQEIDRIQGDKDKLENQITDLETGIKNVKETSEVLKATLETFTTSGDAKVIAISSDSGTLAREQMRDIADNTDKISAEENWDKFATTRKLSDLFALLRGLADNLERSVINATSK